MNQRHRVLLFDIDGTLLVTSVGRRALARALAEAFAIPDPRCELVFGGRTDRSIVEELLRVNRLPVDEIHVDTLRRHYLMLFPALLDDQGGEVLPGVPELLERLAAMEGVTLMAMTGNFVESGREKLRHFGLEHFFSNIFGGGEDHHRDDLARRTARTIRKDLAQDPGKSSSQKEKVDLVIIGDTPADIQCAKAIHAGAIAVCTGGHDRETLAEGSPDLILDDLSDTELVVQQLLSQG